MRKLVFSDYREWIVDDAEVVMYFRFAPPKGDGVVPGFFREAWKRSRKGRESRIVGYRISVAGRERMRNVACIGAKPVVEFTNGGGYNEGAEIVRWEEGSLNSLMGNV
jgi:hypothetical protein